MPHTRFSKLYWLIPKMEINQDKIEIGATDDGFSFWLLGTDELFRGSWVTTHFHLVELKVPNEIIQSKSTT